MTGLGLGYLSRPFIQVGVGQWVKGRGRAGAQVRPDARAEVCMFPVCNCLLQKVSPRGRGLPSPGCCVYVWALLCMSASGGNRSRQHSAYRMLRSFPATPFPRCRVEVLMWPVLVPAWYCLSRTVCATLLSPFPSCTPLLRLLPPPSPYHPQVEVLLWPVYDWIIRRVAPGAVYEVDMSAEARQSTLNKVRSGLRCGNHDACTRVRLGQSTLNEVWVPRGPAELCCGCLGCGGRPGVLGTGPVIGMTRRPRRTVCCNMVR